MRIYLIAEKLGHSFSPLIHSCLSDYSYELREIEKDMLAEFMHGRDFDGLNVTIPYKTAVMEYLDGASDEAKRIGAVNTVVNRSGKLYGYNTDYYGFLYMLNSSKIEIRGKKVLILGSGGASKTVFAVCTDMGAEKVDVLRHSENTSEGMKKYYDAQIIVNTTPVGMYPNNGESAVNIRDFRKCEGVLDLVYNPARTKLLLDAEDMGIKCENGLGMLVAQAKRACEIFTGRNIDDRKIIEITNKIRKMTMNITLIGMPGCGKSTVGRELSRILNRKFSDSDEYISKNGMTPEEIITKLGESEFRKTESEVLCEICRESGYVIATGGGCVTRGINYRYMHQNSVIVFINRDINELETEGRPLSQSGALEKLYKTRMPLYKACCDIEVKSEKNAEETARKIIGMLGMNGGAL